ncbi:MAG: hypothetical protein CMQ65_03415 [Gammaproteobacteria bacterium]|mgnify:FL=1|nr:hypothetical protein [Gammaproteobacteria bacterium]|tara:strand:- start:2726 stop:3463 length:738 start_codon:yes stop_codon:yes gene_type:complete
MNKKDINNKNIIITEKKRIIRNNFLILILALILSLVFIFYTNDFIIENSKSVHNKNISLQEKIDELKHNIAEKEKTIKDLENNYKEINKVFEKYTDAIKFKVATSDEIKTKLFEKDEEILALNRDLNYYKFLINSKDRKNALSIEDVKFEFLPDKKSLKYSFLLLSNNNNKKNIGSFSLYYDVPSSNSNNSDNKKKIKISNNKINFKNYMQISGNARISEGADIGTLFIDVKCNGKIYNHVQIIK